MKYLVLVKSGDDFVLDSPYDNEDVEGAYELAYQALDEANITNDRIVDIRRIYA